MTDAEYCQINNIIIRTSTELPARVSAVCYHDEDGNEFILVNNLCSPEKQKRSLAHEVRHLRRGEMYNAHYREYQ